MRNRAESRKKKLRKQSVVACIAAYEKKYGYAPSVRELCDMLDVRSTSTMHTYLHELIDEGCLHMEPSKPRTVVVSESVAVLYLKSPTESRIKYRVK